MSAKRVTPGAPVTPPTEEQVLAFLAAADEDTVIRVIDRLGSAWSGFEPKQVGKLFEESMPEGLRPLTEDELTAHIVEEARALQAADEEERAALLRRVAEIRATLAKNRPVVDWKTVEAWKRDEAVDDWQRVASLTTQQTKGDDADGR